MTDPTLTRVHLLVLELIRANQHMYRVTIVTRIVHLMRGMGVSPNRTRDVLADLRFGGYIDLTRSNYFVTTPKGDAVSNATADIR